MKCSSCGTELSDGVAFCRECGAKVIALPQKRFCRECGKKLEEGSKFCSYCGADINAVDGFIVNKTMRDNTTTSGSGRTKNNDHVQRFSSPKISSTAPERQATVKNGGSVSDDSKLSYDYGDNSGTHEPTIKKISRLYRKTVKIMKIVGIVLAAIIILILIWPSGKKTTPKPFNPYSVSSESTSVIATEYEGDKKTYPIKVVVVFPGNLVFSKYDVDFIVDGTTKKTIKHGQDDTFGIYIEEGSHVITFAKHGNSSIKGSTTIEITGNLEVSYKISCFNDHVSVELLYIDPDDVPPGKAKINSKASSFVDKDYKEVIAALTDLGFENISEVPVYDIASGTTERGHVKEVTIGGKTDYNRGNLFDKDIAVIVSYHMLVEDDPERPTVSETEPTIEATTIPKETSHVTNWPSHSSGDRAIAKEGDSGVYAFISSGQNYDIYYIIDFEEKIVYYLLYGPNDASGDKAKILHGNLNSGTIIQYTDGNYQWTEGLHFKWSNQPDILIVQDEKGNEYEYTETYLEDALAIRDGIFAGNNQSQSEVFATTEELTLPETSSVPETTAYITTPETSNVPETTGYRRYTNDEVITALDNIIQSQFSQNEYRITIEQSLVNIHFYPNGFTAMAYAASQLKDKDAIKEWNTLVSVAKSWSIDFLDFVQTTLGRDDLSIALYYCDDTGSDNVFLIVMDGIVYYDIVNGINRIG